jgi:hypothetical protein
MTVILPLQMLSAPTAGPGQPERRLMAAVLADAVHTYQRLAPCQTVRARRRFAEIDEWFASDDASHPFAFVRICDVLGLDVDWVRKGLANWRPSSETGTRLAS